MTDKAPELKPCPFCGDPLTVNKAKMVVHSNYDNSECPLFTRGFPADHDASVKAWNRRADLHVKVKPLEFRDSYGVIRADTPFGSYKIAGKILHLPSGASMVSENPESDANEHHRETILSALEPAPMTPAQAAKDALIAAAYSVEKRAEEIVQKHLPVSAFNELRDVAKGLRAIAEGESE